MAEKVDFYKILGIPKNATKIEIKKAYRRVVMQVHPDHKGPEYAPVFRKVKEAYDTLMDDTRRKMYNQYGFSGQSDAELKNEAYNLMRDLVLNTIGTQGDMVFHLNIIDVVQNHCDKTIKKLQDDIDQAVQTKERLKQVNQRFKCKRSNEENMIDLIFVEEHAAIDTQIWDKLAKIQTLKRVNVVIQNYEFQFTKKEEGEESPGE